MKASRPPAPDELLISPLTGEKIPATKVQEHMRIGLLDPRWVEQRDRQIQDKINQETVYAPGRVLCFVLLSVQIQLMVGPSLNWQAARTMALVLLHRGGLGLIQSPTQFVLLCKQ